MDGRAHFRAGELIFKREKPAMLQYGRLENEVNFATVHNFFRFMIDHSPRV